MPATQDALTNEELGQLLELAGELLRVDDYDVLLDKVVQHALTIVRADRGFLVLRHEGDGTDEEDPDNLDLKVIRNWRREELEKGGEAVSRSIIREVLDQGEVLLVEDALDDCRYGQTESVLRQGIRSVLAAPIEVDGRRVGALYLESQSVRRLFGQPQRALFERILELSSRALEKCLRQLVLEERNRALEKVVTPRSRFPGIITQDPTFMGLLEMVAQVATSDLPVLVQGETGTGKELVVRAIHSHSARRDCDLVTVNCGAISPTLLESELFGHVRGAFTDAKRDKVGTITSAHEGTLFLDEVGELPIELQAKLLRTLQFGEVQPVGATQPVHVDVRFVAATNRNLADEVAAGRFREDLLYRLNVVTVELPPLRERPDDVLPLFYHFLSRASNRPGKGGPKPAVEAPRVSPRLERVLEQYHWPGNIRELENEALRLLAVTVPGQPLTVDRLSQRITQAKPVEHASPTTLANFEREVIEMQLRAHGGNRTRTAKALGISREGLRKKMKRLELD